MRVTDLNDAKALISGILAERKEPFTNVVFLACGGSHACFGIYTGKIACIGITIGITILYIKDVNEIDSVF